jgi:hypothetical protein
MMANLIPWDEFEEEYAQNFASDIGAPALPFRVALGALIIKEKLGISDRETVKQIKKIRIYNTLYVKNTTATRLRLTPLY